MIDIMDIDKDQLKDKIFVSFNFNVNSSNNMKNNIQYVQIKRTNNINDDSF